MAQEIGPLRSDHEESDESVVRGDPGVPPEHGLTEHGRPLHLEEEGGAAADVPDAVNVGQVLGGRPRDCRQPRRPLGRCQQVTERSGTEPPSLLSPPDPDAHAEPMPRIRESSKDLRVIRGSATDIIARDETIGTGSRASITRQAGTDERCVGQIGTSEQGPDPLKECGLVQRTGG